jgi:hypothetical protein
MKPKKLVSLKGRSFSDFHIGLTKEEAKKAHGIAHLLLNEKRHRILLILALYPDELYVQEIADVLELPYSTVCIHLSELYRKGFVGKARWKHCMYYFIRQDHLSNIMNRFGIGGRIEKD